MVGSEDPPFAESVVAAGVAEAVGVGDIDDVMVSLGEGFALGLAE